VLLLGKRNEQVLSTTPVCKRAQVIDLDDFQPGNLPNGYVIFIAYFGMFFDGDDLSC
jgi:hypothetical protein